MKLLSLSLLLTAAAWAVPNPVAEALPEPHPEPLVFSARSPNPIFTVSGF